jgi:hypothetical protein
LDDASVPKRICCLVRRVIVERHNLGQFTVHQELACSADLEPALMLLVEQVLEFLSDLFRIGQRLGPAKHIPESRNIRFHCLGLLDELAERRHVTRCQALNPDALDSIFADQFPQFLDLLLLN